MVPLALLVLPVLLWSLPAQANPLVWNAGQDELEMTKEYVVVSAGKTQSQVTGHYIFSRARNPETTYIRLEFPIVAEEKTSLPTPQVKVNGVLTPLFPWRWEKGGPSGLPRPYGLQWFSTEIPVRKLSQNSIEVSVSYTQPHLRKNIACYLPIRPPASNAQIVFQTEPVFRMEALTSGWKSQTENSVVYAPKDRNFLQVLIRPLKKKELPLKPARSTFK
jgi:hypothetical protein